MVAAIHFAEKRYVLEADGGVAAVGDEGQGDAFWRETSFGQDRPDGLEF